MPSGVQRAQSASYESAESKCQCGAGESCIPVCPARLDLICGALCFRRKGTLSGYMKQVSSDLLELVLMQIRCNCVKCLLQCFQVRIQQTFTFKFLLLCFHAVRWSCPLPAPQRKSGLTPRVNVLLRQEFQLQWGKAHVVLSPEPLQWVPSLIASPASVPFCNAVKTFWVLRRVMFYHFQNPAWSLIPSLGCTVALPWPKYRMLLPEMSHPPASLPSLQDVWWSLGAGAQDKWGEAGGTDLFQPGQGKAKGETALAVLSHIMGYTREQMESEVLSGRSKVWDASCSKGNTNEIYGKECLQGGEIQGHLSVWGRETAVLEDIQDLLDMALS